jgi:hypothetical protein
MDHLAQCAFRSRKQLRYFLSIHDGFGRHLPETFSEIPRCTRHELMLRICLRVYCAVLPLTLGLAVA